MSPLKTEGAEADRLWPGEAVRDFICISLAVAVLAHMRLRHLSFSALCPGSKGRASEVWRYEHWANKARQSEARYLPSRRQQMHISEWRKARRRIAAYMQCCDTPLRSVAAPNLQDSPPVFRALTLHSLTYVCICQ